MVAFGSRTASFVGLGAKTRKNRSIYKHYNDKIDQKPLLVKMAHVLKKKLVRVFVSAAAKEKTIIYRSVMRPGRYCPRCH